MYQILKFDRASVIALTSLLTYNCFNLTIKSDIPKTTGDSEPLLNYSKKPIAGGVLYILVLMILNHE